MRYLRRWWSKPLRGKTSAVKAPRGSLAHAIVHDQRPLRWLRRASIVIVGFLIAWLVLWPAGGWLALLFFALSIHVLFLWPIKANP
jgi:hypothetical protein